MSRSRYNVSVWFHTAEVCLKALNVVLQVLIWRVQLVFSSVLTHLSEEWSR